MHTVDYKLGDTVRMRKQHPCGADVFVIIRTGADIKIKCTGCGRIIMLDRPTFNKRIKSVLESQGDNDE